MPNCREFMSMEVSCGEVMRAKRELLKDTMDRSSGMESPLLFQGDGQNIVAGDHGGGRLVLPEQSLESLRAFSGGTGDFQAVGRILPDAMPA